MNRAATNICTWGFVWSAVLPFLWWVPRTRWPGQGVGVCWTSWETAKLSPKVAAAVQSLSGVWSFATPWTEACQASLIHEIAQARLMEWVAVSFSRGSSLPRDQTLISCFGRKILYCWVTREAPPFYISIRNVWEFQLFCVLDSTWYCQVFKIWPTLIGVLFFSFNYLISVFWVSQKYFK